MLTGLTLFMFSQSASSATQCALKHKSCLEEAEKLNRMLDKSDPNYPFFKCMNLAHCSCSFWLCRCTGEGSGNFYSSEPGTVAACQIGCKNYFSQCESLLPKFNKKLDVSGRWNSSFGRMKLSQKGNFIFGTYQHDRGRIEGVLVGRKLIGRWAEAPSYSPPEDAGAFEFEFSQDGKSFRGWWKYGFGKGKKGGSWNGAKENI